MNIYPSFIGNFEYELTNIYLDPFGIKYNSTIANTYNIFLLLLLMIIFEAWISISTWAIFKITGSNKWSWWIKTIHWIIDKIFKLMTFEYFIRNAFELSQFILISSINEIYEHNTKSFERWFSFIFSIIMIISFVIFLGLVLFLALSSYRQLEKKHNKLGEFFVGIKNSKNWKIYVFVLLVRRLIYVILLISLVSISSILLLILMVAIQVAYIVYLVVLRPYEETKGNIIEILNEIYFAILLFVLIFLNTQSDWNSVNTSIYMWALVSNTIVAFLVVLGKYMLKCIVYTIRNLILWIRSRWRKAK